MCGIGLGAPLPHIPRFMKLFSGDPRGAVSRRQLLAWWAPRPQPLSHDGLSARFLNMFLNVFQSKDENMTCISNSYILGLEGFTLVEKCPLASCTYEAANPNTLKSHWSRKHVSTEGRLMDFRRNMQDPREFPFWCKKCQRKFRTNTGLKQHTYRGCAK